MPEHDYTNEEEGDGVCHGGVAKGAEGAKIDERVVNYLKYTPPGGTARRNRTIIRWVGRRFYRLAWEVERLSQLLFRVSDRMM